MSGVSIFNPATVDVLRGLALNGFATRAAVRGTTPLTLARWNPATEGYDALPPRDVVVSYADRADRAGGGDGAAADLVDGWFEAEAPFDVERDDLFSLDAGGGRYLAGRVARVLPPAMGIQRAGWVVRQGEA